MHSEYFIFNALVVFFPVVLSFWRRTFFLPHWPAALLAVSGTSVPFIVWDAAVTGRHWWFNERFISGMKLGPLPIEEVLFFFTMPFACLFTWQVVFDKRSGRTVPSWPLALCLPAGVLMFLTKQPEYTSAAVLALGVAALLARKTLSDSRTYVFLFVVALLNVVFNGYLTGRPVVLYGPAHQLGVRIFTVPVEDFIYGSALVLMNLAVFRALSRWLLSAIPKRLGGYRQTVVVPDTSLSPRVQKQARVCVIGSGIAGLTAATLLAERGFSVTLKEKNGHLGGKVGAWTEDGLSIEHGFHAFFRQYYNLNRLLGRVGVTKHFAAIDDYAILDTNGELVSFKNVAKPPLINLLSLAHEGIVPWRDLLTNPKLQKLDALMRYEDERTHETLDQVSFAEFAEAADLPPRLKLAFNTFARAFFSEERRMSMAELIKGFHFYYLSNDCGLLYDYLDDSYDTAFLKPFRQHLEKHGVTIELNTPVTSIDASSVNGEPFDAIVLAADAAATKTIVQRSPLGFNLDGLKASQRYAVLRVWLDRDCPRKYPVFLVTEREDVLDAITFNHWFQPEMIAWAKQHGGGVYEAHCYAVPDTAKDDEIEAHFLAEMKKRIPELADAKVIHSHLQVRKDFTAFEIGCYANRPKTQTPLPNVVLAGDWVRLPYPAMLMEAACMSGVLAANAICALHGVRGEQVEAVPAKGILA